MKSLLTIASLLALTTTASAESEPRPAQVSEEVALGLSVGGTVASYAAIIAGVTLDQPGLTSAGAVGAVFAPTAGHWYAHKVVSRGLVLRATGLAVAVGGFLAFSGDRCFCTTQVNDDRDQGDWGSVGLSAVLGAGLFVAGTVDDIAQAKTAARKYNEKQVMIVPTTNTHGGGLALVGTF